MPVKKKSTAEVFIDYFHHIETVIDHTINHLQAIKQELRDFQTAIIIIKKTHEWKKKKN